MFGIRFVGFRPIDIGTLKLEITEPLNKEGLGASWFYECDSVVTGLCMTDQPYPYVIVTADKQHQLDKAAEVIHKALGVMVQKQICQEFIPPDPNNDWVRRCR